MISMATRAIMIRSAPAVETKRQRMEDRKVKKIIRADLRMTGMMTAVGKVTPTLWMKAKA